MVTLTFKITQNAIIVHDGKLPGARLKYYAPGMEIYLSGVVTTRRRDAVNGMAFDCALAHHIPLISLKSVNWI